MSETYQSIVVLTGAGISAESGIQTFCASDGLWEGHPVEEVATPEGFAIRSWCNSFIMTAVPG